MQNGNDKKAGITKQDQVMYNKAYFLKKHIYVPSLQIAVKSMWISNTRSWQLWLTNLDVLAFLFSSFTNME